MEDIGKWWRTLEDGGGHWKMVEDMEDGGGHGRWWRAWKVVDGHGRWRTGMEVRAGLEDERKA